jgi:hypothetical protein
MDKVNNYSQVDSNILELQLTTDKAYKSQHTLTLTNYDNTTVPAIAAGSAIEVNGTLYKADTEEAISTTDPVTSATVADGTVYVCIVPGATTATAAFTATAPTWSDSKQGWYGTGGQANYRYAEYLMTKATAEYSCKASIQSFVKTCIYVSNTNTQTLTGTNPVKIVFDKKIYDAKNEFDVTTNYRFTAKSSGYYLITSSFLVITQPTFIYLYKNGDIIESGKYLLRALPGYYVHFSYLAYVMANEYLEIYGNPEESGSSQITTDITRLNIIQVA